MKTKEYKYKINGIKFNVTVGEVVDNTVNVEVNGTPYKVELDKAPSQKVSISAPKPAAAAPRTESGEKVISRPAPVSGSASAVKSPLPGTIMSFKVQEGQTVKAGDTVCVLEAMKMENDIHTNFGGTVKKILVKVGDAVLEGTDLIIIE
ncbi:MAG: biotin/lipoyl-binding protein [Muribaculaceae bacterium]|nr:biotin/lipoyl-binding protein [Muribaculaceae bacterium]